MDGNRFDTMVHALGERLGRRDALKIAAASTIGGAGIVAATESVLGKSCKNNNDCPEGKVCRHKKKKNNGKRRGRCK